MPIDPDRLRGGRDSFQSNSRFSLEAELVLRYLAVRDEECKTPQQLIMKWVAAGLEAEAPEMREFLDQPQLRADEFFAQTLAALDVICPPDYAFS